ncbi:hypothetical protein MKW35_16275, partial [Aestuariibaculum sp. L182]|nr:hypothetical protein [Aestuariibaculum lutulentum]
LSGKTRGSGVMNGVHDFTPDHWPANQYGKADWRQRGGQGHAMLMPQFPSNIRWQNVYDRFAPGSTAEKRSNHLRLVICHIFDYTARSDRLCLPL